MSSNQTLSSLLEKTEHYDKDERYMATSDLCNILQKHASSSSSSTSHSKTWMDSNKERRICSRILSLLDDSSNDVQAIAVKTLGVLLMIVQEEQVQVISERLCTLLLKDGKNELRDVYSIGLRTLIKTIPTHMGDSIVSRLTSRLLNEGLVISSSISSSEEKDQVYLSCLEVLQDVVSRFGNKLYREHERILNTCFELIPISGHKSVLQKRACNVIGTLSTYLNEVLLSRCVETLLSKISNKACLERKAFIRTMCIVSHTVGHRLGKDIERIVPIFLSCSQITEQEEEEEDEDEHLRKQQNELRESCFAGFESFVLYCPDEVEPFLNDIVQVTLKLMIYDPNYSYDDNEDDNDEVMEDTNDGDDDDWEDDDEYDDEEDLSDDDDDESWKVRRSAVRCLLAIITAMKADPTKLWVHLYPYNNIKKTVSEALLDRFKEREDNCRKDVIDCFTKLLSVTIDASFAGTLSFDTPKDNISTVIDVKSTTIPTIIQSCRQILQAGKKGRFSSSANITERTKSSAIALLSTLCRVPNGIGSSISQIDTIFSFMTAIISADASSNKTLKLDALTFINTLLTQNTANAKIIGTALVSCNAIKPLCKAVEEDWYKVIAESLRVLSEVPRYTVLAVNTNKCPEIASMLYDAIKPKLSAYDLDQEIKDCSLIGCGTLLSYLSSYLSSEQTNVLLKLILDRLKNETTRLSALKTLNIMCSSKSSIDISVILPSTMKELAILLRQQNRALQLSVLDTINVLVHFSSKSDNNDMDQVYSTVLKETASTISEVDLHIANLGLAVTSSILQVKQAVTSIKQTVKEFVIPPTLVLCTSNSLQDGSGETTGSLLHFLELLVLTDTIDFQELYEALYERSGIIGNTASKASSTNPGSTSPTGQFKNAYINLSKCLAVITTTKNTDVLYKNQVIDSLLSVLKSNKNLAHNATQLYLSLLVLGEIGFRTKFTPHISKQILHIYLEIIMDASSNSTASTEELKHAAAYALGRVAVCDQELFLSQLLNALESSQASDNKMDNHATQKIQYLLLSALKEFIICLSSSGNHDGDTWVKQITPHLIKHACDKEESVRMMVAECLGCLTSFAPEFILPQLRDLVQKHSSGSTPQDTLFCWTCLHAIKFAIASSSVASKDYLKEYIPSFLPLLEEKYDLSVRNAALMMVYSAVHHSPYVVVDQMEKVILPSLFMLAQLNLKRVVDLGPFKHTVDDALPLRKSSYSIFSTSLENCPAALADLNQFLPILIKGLSDDTEDIQLQAHSILISMCRGETSGNRDKKYDILLLSFVDNFCDPLERCIWKKLGTGKSGTELERANEWIKSGLRALLAVSQVEGAMRSSRKLSELLDRTKNNQKYSLMLQSLGSDELR